MAAVQLHVEVSGSGSPTLIFSHGWADDASAWAGVVEQLSARYRCVTWDLRGHGRSEAPPPGNYTRADALGDMERVITSTSTSDRPVVLIGHSLGGYLSLAETLTHPSRVAALVLVAAGPGFRKSESREQWNQTMRSSAQDLNMPPGSEEIVTHSDSWVIDELATIDKPTLLILGERDRRYEASMAVFEKNLDVRASVIVPDSGHSVHRRQPAAVATAIEDFVVAIGDDRA